MSSLVKSKRSRRQVHYMMQDWPDDMHISNEAFEAFAHRLEREDFEDDIRCLSSSLNQLVDARNDTISKLRVSAEYLDSIWYRCRVSKSVGTSASVVGGSLTIAGGILTLATAGAGAPLLIAGIATSSVGAATNIGTSLVERIINSKQIRDMGNALERDKDITLKIESQIDDIQRYKDSVHLGVLLGLAEKLLGKKHILIAILQSVFAYDLSGVIGMSSKFLSENVHLALTTANEMKTAVSATAASTANSTLVATGAAGAMGAVTAGAVKACSAQSSKEVVKATTKDGLKYNPLGPDLILETGKVVGQNSTRLAGQVIIGVSAAFLVWDTIDLGWTIADLVRKKGSQAARILKAKADELEMALKETKENYSVDLVRD